MADREGLLAAARELGPLIRAHSEAAERGRHFRDAQTFWHHGFLSENRFEAVGQVYFGVPHEFPMMAF